MKIINDKYYTSENIAKYCVDKTIEIIGDKNITEFVEPSAGSGVFIKFFNKPYIAYDIEPGNTNIIKQDYLLLNLEYKKGRCVIGNPPYGKKMYLAQQFYKKSAKISDYIAFILPISQLNNNITLNNFGLVYSQDLGEQMYSDRKLHCCLNIYSRYCPKKKNVHKLKSITICRQDSKNYKDFEYDIRMCYWGNGTAGKILNNDEKYSAEYKIKINNKELYDKIYKVIIDTDWKSEVKCIAMKKIQQWHILNKLIKEVPNID